MSNPMNKDKQRHNMRGRMSSIAFLILTLGFGYVIFCFHNLQIKRHDELLIKAKRNYTSKKTVRGQRGSIYDRNGSLLASNQPCYTLFADPINFGNDENREKTATYLAQKLNLNRDFLLKKFKKISRMVKSKDNKMIKIENRYASIAREVNFEVGDEIKQWCVENNIGAITFSEQTKRYYPKNGLLANVIGFTSYNKGEEIPVIGIERALEELISATEGTFTFERSVDNVPLAYGNKKLNMAIDGIDVYLTVDEAIQSFVEEELQALADKWRPKTAYAILADPYTGDILAIAQRPSFNPNDRRGISDEQWTLRIATDIYEPGSTMKPLSISGAIDRGLVSPNTVFDCENGYWRDYKLRDSSVHGPMTVQQIVQKSSNIGTAKIAIIMGKNLLYKTLWDYGFGQRTGLPLKPTESRGILPNPRRDKYSPKHPQEWWSISITRIPMGQGVAVTPVQMVRAFCILANGGWQLKLNLVSQLKQHDNKKTLRFPVKRGKNIFQRKNTAKIVRQMMATVTEAGGTARKARLKGYTVAGKTGTSQKVINGRYSNSKYIASFIGMVPATNPRFVLLVVADEPQGAYYGGTVAGPTFRKISERVVKYLNIAPDRPEELEDEDKAVRLRTQGDDIRSISPRTNSHSRRRRLPRSSITPPPMR
ncbi:penicillin-binding protein 2 [Lentisphaerota bacterium WC36G]|nr:penicillin-binding protein 2 [Lentisphaerae bacterium WC36]